MISLDRFKALETKTLCKKASLLISQHLSGHMALDGAYVDAIFTRIGSEYPEDANIQNAVKSRIACEGLLPLKDYLDWKSGRMGADLDYLSDNGSLDVSERIIEERYLILDDIRSPYNLGSIIRSAESFKIKEIILLSDSLSLNHPNAKRAACRTDSIMPCRVCRDRTEGLELIKSLKMPVFALECGGEDIASFPFPDKGAAVIGNEEFGVGKDIIRMAQSIVGIPLFGSKGSISVSCAAAIMMQYWSRR